MSEFIGGASSKEAQEIFKKLGKLIMEQENNPIKEKYKDHLEICNELNQLYIAKNKEYGDSFGKAYDELGLGSAVSDIFHKTQRLVGIYQTNKEDIKYESIEDTLMDLANYSLMTLVELKK